MYKTSNLALATALQVASLAKVELIELDPSNYRATFHFDRTKDPHFDEFIEAYWQKKLPIDASTYFEALRLLKNRMYQNRYDK